ncbi:GMC family oxidoreductase [soil metagenome]
MDEEGTIVVGGGTCGAAIAGRLAESGQSVVLIEAGPDFGPFDSGRWPARLIDPSLMPIDLHSWHYANDGQHGRTGMSMQRARVIGGCSSHNGCAVVWGHRSDYDGWADLGNTGWGADDVTPFFRSANERFRVNVPDRTEITPFHQAVLDSASAAGLPPIADFSDLDIEHGLGIGPVNISGLTRWNAAFAYVDPVRDLANFSLESQTMANRVLIKHGRASGVEVTGPDGIRTIRASRVILAGGAYGTPLLLQRSGIGDPSNLEAAGIEVAHSLPGVGKNLQDHPAAAVKYSGTPELTAMLDAFVANGGLPREEGTIALASSRRCEGPFDLHLYPIAHRNGPGDWDIFIGAAVMASRSTGQVRVLSGDPESAPLIEHRYVTDPEGYDLDGLVDGVRQARDLASQQPLASLIGQETFPGESIESDEALRALIPAISEHDYHPTSTCKMGRTDDPSSVVDATARVPGIEGLLIGDASIMPNVPKANTNLPALMVAEKIAAGLLR